ncbi:haloacid dehalogenase type II [Bosea sp. PAMC 26642]|uniref:haloacid dehalogenase type II n=1 Tax=Bosea sp. (strain PAMC 26642) TaxID=1792307 RepID=UPI00077036AC|nr:haloacid dehalogenase type II [Bosea sp. PAMC 26642]AMJ62679.1 haloacid dehalogenase [Bosea sp. PAMC 26642]
MTIKAFVFDAYGTLYDVQSVASLTEAAFPGHGETITQIWRMKQLEYTWLRSLMNAYLDFWTVTQDSLVYALDVLGLDANKAAISALAQAYNHLVPFPDSVAALDAMADRRLAILSNGSPAMLTALLANSGLTERFEVVISVDAAGAYKPDPRSYGLVEAHLGVKPDEVVFVSSNGFDVAGAKRFGFRVARIARVSPSALHAEIGAATPIAPKTLFKALRMQEEHLGEAPDWTVASLGDLPALMAGL